jgi:hypothetical protein
MSGFVDVWILGHGLISRNKMADRSGYQDVAVRISDERFYKSCPVIE